MIDIDVVDDDDGNNDAADVRNDQRKMKVPVV
jgi:hypothetical protein